MFVEFQLDLQRVNHQGVKKRVDKQHRLILLAEFQATSRSA